MGTLLVLAGGTCTLFQGALTAEAPSQPTDLVGIFRNTTFFVGVGLLVLGVLSIGAGSGSLAGRAWARWTGAAVSTVLAIFFWLMGVVTLGTQNGATAAVILLVMGILYAMSGYALFAARSWFGARR